MLGLYICVAVEVFAVINRLFFRSVDAASLAVFRVLFGALMLFEAVNYGVFLCLDCKYRDTSMLFKYHYFEWAVMPPGAGLEWLFLVMGLSALCVMLGLFYRLATIVLVITFSWHFLLDQALYLNHFYLAILFAIIMVFMPADRYLSLDALRHPSIRSCRVPNWTYLWLGAQLEIVLLYAGFVKLNSDWLQLEPMRVWMNELSRDEGALLQWMTQDWGIAIASYSVIILHLVGAPLLLWRRTRLAVLCLYAVFHLSNSFVFNIGIFPWMTLGATLLLFDPDWPRQVLRWLQQRGKGRRFKTFAMPLASDSDVSALPGWSVRVTIIFLIAVWLMVQTVVPLRHFTQPGNVVWNEDGHRFSWRMKLRTKRGTARFYLKSDDGHFLKTVDPAQYLNAKQVRKMSCIPDLLWQFAQFLEEQHSNDGARDIEVYVDTACSVNTRKAQPLVNRQIDLTSIERDTPSTEWITPLKHGLPNPLF